jgi:hypothetical protein
MAMGHPIAAQQGESGWGERHVTIPRSLPAVDMDHHAAAVDIGDFEMEAFVKPQAQEYTVER